MRCVRKSRKAVNLYMAEKKTFEDKIQMLEEIIDKLQKGEASLDECIKLYEKGTVLSAECIKMLENAEQKVNMISNGKNTEV